MARDNILLAYIAVDVVFAITGALLLVFAINTQNEIKKPFTLGNVVTDLLLGMCPLNAAIANAVMVFMTFVVSIPAIVMPSTRGWLKIHGYLTVICGVFTLILGLTVWYDTLKTRENLNNVWLLQKNTTQSLVQQALNCCGYFNSTSPTFAKDATCPDPVTAASKIGCVSPFSLQANNFLDIIFTGAFGFVGVDALLVILTAIVLKDRKEKERYRFIDEKNGAGGF